MRLALLLLPLLLLALTGAAGAHAEANGPSFDCAKAHSNAEVLVCSDDDLKAIDLTLNGVYRDAAAAWPDRADQLQAEQRRWLKQRDGACGPAGGANVSVRDENRIGCMTSVYSKRIDALVTKALDPIWQGAAEAPEQALARLKPLHSPIATAYVDLLTHALSSESVQRFSDFAGALAERTHDPRANLGFFQPITMPCTLVVRYPRLLLVSRSYFGSSADAFLPTADCGDNYQAYPAVVANFLTDNPKTLENWQNRCWPQGSMSHAFARDAWLHELRMSRFPRSYLTGAVTWTTTPDKPWPDAQTLADSDWDGDPEFVRVVGALADYYRHRFGLSPAEADTAATRALWDNRNMGSDPDKC